MGQHSIKKPLNRVTRNGACLMADSKQLVKETAHSLDNRISNTIQIVDDSISNVVSDARLEVSELSKCTQQKVKEIAPKIITAVVDELSGSYEKATQAKDNAAELIKETAQIVDSGISNTVQNSRQEFSDFSERIQQKIGENTPKIKALVDHEIQESRQIVKRVYVQSSDVLKSTNYSRTGKAVVVGVFVVNGLVQTNTVNASQNVRFNQQHNSSQFDNFQLTAYKKSKVDSDSSGFIRQVAQYGQTVWTLGQQDGFSVSQWSGVNPGVNPNNILAGQTYNIPTTPTPESTPTTNTPSNEVPSTQNTSLSTTPQSNNTTPTPESTPTTNTPSNEVPSTQNTSLSTTPQSNNTTPTISPQSPNPSDVIHSHDHLSQPIIAGPPQSNNPTTQSNANSLTATSLKNQPQVPATNLNPFLNPNPLSISSLKINNLNNALEGTVTMQEVITYLQQNSTLSDTAIAGIVGNLNYESSLNTERYENTFPANALTPANSLTTAELNNSSMGWGLAQWTPAEKIIGWAENQDLNPNSMSTQVQFIVDNIQNSPALYENLMAATSPSDAADIFMKYYEMPSNYNSASSREAYANQAFSVMQQ